MKTLSLQQPWATLIAYGIKDVENRTWETPYRGRILLHASSKKVPQNYIDQLPVEWTNEICNAVWMEGMPDLPDMPLGAIVGYADLVDCKRGLTGSLWDGNEGDVKFILKNAFLFDEPIKGVKGKLGLWEYDLDESNLPPAHKAERPLIKLEGKKLTVQYDKATLDDDLEADSYVSIASTDAADKVLLDRKTMTAKNAETVTFQFADGTARSYRLPQGLFIANIPDADGQTIMLPGLYEESVPWQLYALILGEEIK